MSRSDVRSIDSLGDLRRALSRLSERLATEGQQLRHQLQRAQQHFETEVPAYWTAELKRAERGLQESQDRLSRKQTSVRSGDSVPATDEKKEVARWKARRRTCQEKLAVSRRVAVEMLQTIERAHSPVADLVEQAEVVLPTAVGRLQQLIDRLEAYRASDPGKEV